MQLALDDDLAAPRYLLNPMANGVLDQWLKDQRRHHRILQILVDARLDIQPSHEAYLHDVHITIEQLEFGPECNLCLVRAIEIVSQQFAQLRQHSAYAARIALNECRHGIERVEEKMRVQLTAQCVQPCLCQLRLQQHRLCAPGSKPE